MTDDGQGSEIFAKTSNLTIATLSASARLRYNRAQQLYSGAIFFASELKEWEDQHRDAPYGPHVDRATWLFTASLMSSIACLEASYNEAVEDLKADQRVFTSVDRLSTLDKYNLLLRFHQLDGVELDKEPAQSVALAIKLRNAIAHFRPEWADNAKTSARLEASLRGMDSPLMSETQVFFPMRCSSAERAYWATEAVYNLVKNTRESLGLKFDWKH